MTEFDIVALEKALSGKERRKKEPQKTKGHRSDKPLFATVDKEGKEVEPNDIEEGKSYGLKHND